VRLEITRRAELASVSLDDVSVPQVIEAVEGATDPGRSVVADLSCQTGAPCVLHTAWGPARTELVDVLTATAMSDLGSSGS
jgi:DNA-binding IscR family transcriptional regulator